jgi:uncharacterized protein (DUF58 family)
MHLTARSLVLVALAALLAIAALWSGAATLRGLWAAPLMLLALGLASESHWQAKLVFTASPLLPRQFFLGRHAVVVLRLRHDAAVAVRLELIPCVPDGMLTDSGTRRLILAPRQQTELAIPLTPVALGEFRWPALPARLVGFLGLARWSRELAVDGAGSVLPDLRVHLQSERLGWRAGLLARRDAGSGSDLRQLRAYRPGDPPSRVAWRSSARHGALLVREPADEQQLDLLLVVDAGLRSRARAGALDRLGVAINAAAGFAESAVARDDRVGLLIYADRPLAIAAPARGTAALLRVRALLGAARGATLESEPIAAALQARRLLRHRGLIVWLTEVTDAAAADDLGGVLQVLTPPHLVIFAGVSGDEISALARTPARNERDAWLALAAAESEERLAAGLQRLRRRGAPVVAAPAERLEPAVLATYSRLRARRRI